MHFAHFFLQKLEIKKLNPDFIISCLSVNVKKSSKVHILQSGCIKSKDSKQLVIALEPEAGSFYCRQLDLSPFQESELCFPSGMRYLVLDCGGRTSFRNKSYNQSFICFYIYRGLDSNVAKVQGG